jgi:hypothetical protein
VCAKDDGLEEVREMTEMCLVYDSGILVISKRDIESIGSFTIDPTKAGLVQEEEEGCAMGLSLFVQ